MKRSFKRSLQRLLSRFQVGLFRIPAENFHKSYLLLTAQYENAVKEICGCIREFVFRDLYISSEDMKLITQLYGTGISEALYLIHYLRSALALDGDVCEFGTANGATSALLAQEILSTNKKLWLFDSFQGLPKPTAKDRLVNDIFNLGSIEKYEGTMLGTIVELQERIEAVRFPRERAQIVPGLIEDTIKCSQLPRKVCFAYVDFDFYRPIRTALEYLDTCISAQGVVMVDDYGFFSEGAKSAVDQFLSRDPERYTMILPEKFAGHFCILIRKEV